MRSAGGKNNSPNGLQPKNILRTLLSHTNMVLGVGTDVVGQVTTTLLSINSTTVDNLANANTKENSEHTININS